MSALLNITASNAFWNPAARWTYVSNSTSERLRGTAASDIFFHTAASGSLAKPAYFSVQPFTGATIPPAPLALDRPCT